MYCCLLLQISVLLMTASVLQDHILSHHKNMLRWHDMHLTCYSMF